MERTDYKQILILFGTTGVVYLCFRYLLPLVIPFLFSYLIAVWIYPVAAYFKKKWKISNGISGAAMMILLVCILGMGVFGLGKILFSQVRNVVANIPRYETIILAEVQDISGQCDRILGVSAGDTFQFVSQNIDAGILRLEEQMTPILSAETIGSVSKVMGVFWIVFIVVMGAFFIIKDMEDLKIIFEESPFFLIGKRVFGNLGQVGGAYLKTQLIIMLSSAVVCSGGLMLIKIPNSLLWGVGISIFDAFPVLGSGLILIPWALLSLLKGNWYHGAVLFTIFVICQLIREVTEAKILGGEIGIKPVFTIISMYIGTELFGIAGFILGPVGFLLIKNCVQSQY